MFSRKTEVDKFGQIMEELTVVTEQIIKYIGPRELKDLSPREVCEVYEMNCAISQYIEELIEFDHFLNGTQVGTAIQDLRTRARKGIDNIENRHPSIIALRKAGITDETAYS